LELLAWVGVPMALNNDSAGGRLAVGNEVKLQLPPELLFESLASPKYHKQNGGTSFGLQGSAISSSDWRRGKLHLPNTTELY
jgi:hypothetical protein